MLLAGCLGLAIAAVSHTRWYSPGSVRPFAFQDGAAHWRNHDFVRLEPPIHLPSSAPDVDQVEIWLRIPSGGVIDFAGGGPSFPPGTEIDRAEFAGLGRHRRVVDVRGTRIDGDGRQWFRVARPQRAASESPLVGVEWPRGDPDVDREATKQMADVIVRLEWFQRLPAAKQAAYLDSFRKKNDCSGCHEVSRPTSRTSGEFGVVNRGTDASGFFVPQSVLGNDAPLEDYGRFDRNPSDPFVEIHCPGNPPNRVLRAGGNQRVRCPDRSVATARYDVAAALGAGDPRAVDLCHARRYLVQHLKPEDRTAFAAAVDECATTR